MDAIRALAQVSKPTLYNHFDSKENLFLGIVEHSLDDVSAAWDQLVSETQTISSRHQLRQILIRFARAGVDHLLAPQTVRLARTLLAETSSFPDLGAEFRKRIPQRAAGMISAVLTNAHEQGLLHLTQERIPAAVRFFMAQLLSYLLLDGLLLTDQVPTKPSINDLEEMIDLYIEMI
jgi:AcrR family transcriptional regulator